MRNLKISHRYAKALFDLAKERDRMDEVHGDLKEIATLISRSPELSGFLKDPIISFDKQKDVLEDLFKGGVDGLTLTFLLFLAERKKIARLESICDIFAMYYDKFQGRLNVIITSPSPMRDDQIVTISGKLKEFFKKEIQPRAKLDPDLIGGFKVQVGDVIYDYSIRAQLAKFRKMVLTTY